MRSNTHFGTSTHSKLSQFALSRFGKRNTAECLFAVAGSLREHNEAQFFKLNNYSVNLILRYRYFSALNFVDNSRPNVLF